jgi:hypothetical protein
MYIQCVFCELGVDFLLSILRINFILRFTLSEIYLYQKDEWALPGNLQSRNNFLSLLLKCRSRDSVDGIATGCGLDDQGVGVLVPLGSKFSLINVVQIGSGAHSSSYLMDTGN